MNTLKKLHRNSKLWEKISMLVLIMLGLIIVPVGVDQMLIAIGGGHGNAGFMGMATVDLLVVGCKFYEILGR